jgi:hypothetical protein
VIRKWLRAAGSMALIVVATALVGCDSVADKFFDAVSGRQTNLVILSKQPVTLSPSGYSTDLVKWGH